MISVDRTSPRSVTEQLVDQLRYKVASDHYKIGDVMPSTRTLAAQVGVSFHSVRKAYQALEREGLLEARHGAGYVVRERKPLGKAERIEQGAALVRGALEQLIGLGLDGSDIEYLFQEQLDLMESAAGTPKLVFAASCTEMAGLCAQQVAFAVQLPVEGLTLSDLPYHKDADYVATPFDSLRQAMEAAPQSEIVGVSTYLQHETLEHVSRLLPNQTVGLVTLYGDTIPPLTAQLRQHSGFAGQVLATSLEGGDARLEEFMHQIDLLLYTPDCRRRLHSVLGRKQPNTVVAPVVSRESLERIRALVAS